MHTMGAETGGPPKISTLVMSSTPLHTLSPNGQAPIDDKEDEGSGPDDNEVYIPSPIASGSQRFRLYLQAIGHINEPTLRRPTL